MNRYMESKGVRPTEPLQYSVKGNETPHTGIDEVDGQAEVTRKEILMRLITHSINVKRATKF